MDTILLIILVIFLMIVLFVVLREKLPNAGIVVWGLFLEVFFDDVFDGAAAGDGLVVEIVEVPVFRRISNSGHLNVVELEKLERIVPALTADSNDGDVYFVTRGNKVGTS